MLGKGLRTFYSFGISVLLREICKHSFIPLGDHSTNLKMEKEEEAFQVPHAISNQRLWVMAPLASPRKRGVAEPKSPPSKSKMCHTPSDSDSGLAWDSEDKEKMWAQKSPRLMGLGV